MSLILVLFTDTDFKALEINTVDWIFVNLPKNKILQCENCRFFFQRKLLTSYKY